jgi:hypothetical protein
MRLQKVVNHSFKVQKESKIVLSDKSNIKKYSFRIEKESKRVLLDIDHIKKSCFRIETVSERIEKGFYRIETASKRILFDKHSTKSTFSECNRCLKEYLLIYDISKSTVLE